MRAGWAGTAALARRQLASGSCCVDAISHACKPAHVVRAVLKMGLIGSDSANVTAHGSTSDSHLCCATQVECDPTAPRGKQASMRNAGMQQKLALPLQARRHPSAATLSRSPHLLLLLLRNAMLSPPASSRPATSGAASGSRLSEAYSSFSGVADACVREQGWRVCWGRGRQAPVTVRVRGTSRGAW